jgi:hypothetical protein
MTININVYNDTRHKQKNNIFFMKNFYHFRENNNYSILRTVIFDLHEYLM